MLLSIGTSDAFRPGHGVPLRHLDNREIKAFAKKVFDEFECNEIAEARAWKPSEETTKRLRWLLHEGFPRDVLYGEVDINDDGIPERFIEIQDHYWCGTVGCITFVYRRTPAGFELICETDLGDPLPKTHDTGTILAATEDGYHLIDTADGIVHWNMKEKPGNQCETISYKG
jgi:hypothetical protein